MALTWEWKEKCGEVIVEQKTESGDWRQFPLSLYTGNAFLIMLYEYQEDGKDMYSMYSFWSDKRHAQNCLGLDKKNGYTENIYANKPYERFLKFRLDKRKCRYLKDIVPLLTQAFDNITIEIYSDDEQPNLTGAINKA